NFVEQLSRPPDERQALLVLLGAGPFADEHEIGVGVAHAEHDLGAARGGELALGASRRLFGQHLERRGHERSGYFEGETAGPVAGGGAGPRGVWSACSRMSPYAFSAISAATTRSPWRTTAPPRPPGRAWSRPSHFAIVAPAAAPTRPVSTASADAASQAA